MTTAERPSFVTFTEAAALCKVNRSTIRRAFDADRFPSARRTPGKDGKPEHGPWIVSLDDLRAIGLTPGTPEPATEAVQKTTTVESLRAELDDWRRRAEVAEALAAERADTLAAERASFELALRQLTVGTPDTVPTSTLNQTPLTDRPAPTVEPTGPKQSWWRRRAR